MALRMMHRYKKPEGYLDQQIDKNFYIYRLREEQESFG